MGEPLLNPDLVRFISHVSADARTSFSCNGVQLTEETVCRLKQAGLDALYMSFDGDEPELFGQMMGGLPFKKISAVRNCVRLRPGLAAASWPSWRRISAT
jgi:MoaA/NifB/PqqE/SkfB family radical SAM enzyme